MPLIATTFGGKQRNVVEERGEGFTLYCSSPKPDTRDKGDAAADTDSAPAADGVAATNDAAANANADAAATITAASNTDSNDAAADGVNLDDVPSMLHIPCSLFCNTFLK